MSEPFATTVAAVAPVIWLVGAVEFHQASKRANDHGRSAEALMRARLEMLRAAEDATVARDEWSAEERRQLHVPWTMFPLYAIWGALAASLAITTVKALRWLGDVDPGPEPGTAIFCYWSVAVSLLVVTMLPAGLVVFGMLGVDRRGKALHREINALRAAAAERSDPSE